MISPRPTHPRSLAVWLVACAGVLATAGCSDPPGKPGPGPEVPRPDQVLDFATLYSRNCAACHGANGHNGDAISLANPVYLATAGVTNIQRITAEGVPNTAMPPFGNAKGGMLTDQQIAILANGLLQAWGNPSAPAGATPAYAATAPGDADRGHQVFTTYCAPCHGADGTGGKTRSGALVGSLVDPAYLALISDQGLRSIVIAGQPDQGMPAWNTRPNFTAGRPINDQEITDIVAWLTSHRIATPGSPYKPHP
jgi:mono/diheme cytochrome c family protein